MNAIHRLIGMRGDQLVRALLGKSLDGASDAWHTRYLAAGIGCVAVETGGFSRHELLEEGAVAVYRDPEELWRQLATSPIGMLTRIAR